MSKDKIWLSSPHMGGAELRYVQEAFEQNWIAPLGPHVNGLEKKLCEFTGAQAAAALSSGTAALHLALVNEGVAPGDEVLCQSLTFAASANAIAYQFATPIFVDSEWDTWNMDPEALETAIKDRLQKGKQPKACIVVHLYGMPAKMDELQAVCDRYGIPLIEDAAEAIGSSYKNQPCGTFGKCSALSFNGNKIITTSGGGALLSDDAALIEHIRFLSTQARDPAPHYEHSHVGYNYRMSNICAAIGLGQLEVLPQRVEAHRELFAWYQELLAGTPGLSFQPEPEGYFANRWLTCLYLDPQENPSLSREKLRLALSEENIDARPLWKPMHLQPVYQEAPYYGSGVAERLFAHGLCLPSGSNMGQKQKERIRVTLLAALE